MRYDILTEVLLKNPVFWDVMLCWAADRGTVIPSSVRNCSPSRTVSHAITLQSSFHDVSPIAYVTVYKGFEKLFRKWIPSCLLVKGGEFLTRVKNVYQGSKA